MNTKKFILETYTMKTDGFILKAFLVLKIFSLIFLHNQTYGQEVIQRSALNLSDEELNEILRQGRDLNNSEISDIEIEDNLEKPDNYDEIQYNDDIFGYSFFLTKNETNTPILDIPLLTDYRLSFNDKLELTLVGGVNKVIPLRIDLGGSVVIPEIGKVALLNLSLSNAEKKIASLIANSYVGTSSYLSVSEASLKKISVIGAVNSPGTYVVNPFILLSEAIKYAGGLEKNGSLRNIEIISQNGESLQIDMYDFLIFGDRQSDISLNNGDTVKLNSTSNFFSLEGAVNRPKTYEYKQGDSINKLISFGLGSKRNANLNKITLNEFSSNLLISKNVELKDEVLSDIDSLYIASIFYENDQKAKIIGSPVSDGFYDYEKGESLSALISKLSFSSKVFPYGFILEQEEIINGNVETKLIKLSLVDRSDWKNVKKIMSKKSPFKSPSFP